MAKISYIDICSSDGTTQGIFPDLAKDSGAITEKDIYASETYNANGERIADYITTKISISCKFPPLSAQEWNAITNYFKNNKTFHVKYFNPNTKSMRVMKAYVSNRQATPNMVSLDTAEPEFYTNCSFTIEEV